MRFYPAVWFVLAATSFPTAATTNHWAFQKLSRLEAPVPSSVERVRNAIDRFVQARLEQNGLKLSPRASIEVLVRRAYLDLTGLLPSPGEVEAVIDESGAASKTGFDRQHAFECLVDRLLASPHFGERWGRHWLDWAGYADVLGGDNDAGRIKFGDGKWLYREYVIRSLNQDKPYNQFLIEQLAGDELVDWRNAPKFTDQIREMLAATGFLRTASDDTDEDELNTPGVRHDVLQRTGEIVANNLLGLTLQCAKCHDHKYEPVSQRDYYRYLSIFSPAFNPSHWLQPQKRALPDVSAAEKAGMEKFNAPLDADIAGFKKEQDEIRRPYKEKLFQTKLERIPESIRADTKLAIETAADKRTEIQKYLAGKFEKELTVKADETVSALSDADKATIAELDSSISKLAAKRRTWGTLQAVYDLRAPAPLHILNRGDANDPGEEVEPEVFAVLRSSGTHGDAGDPLPFVTADGKIRGRCLDHSSAGSGRRLAFAHWLTNPGTPAEGLLARVFVNRVWQQLFGKGLVETSENLGVSGAKPTHPQLLEWLAWEFVNDGWRIKPLIKLIMSSQAYQQTAASAEAVAYAAGDRSDPSNELVWRQRLRRLESEIVRDAILCASGSLDRTMGHAPLSLETRPDGLVDIREKGLPAPTAKLRRSIYVLARRNYHLSLLNTFDQPAVATSCTRRAPSAVVAQSLTMLNDRFVLEQADAFAERLIREVPNAGENVPRIELAFKLALTRGPAPDELKWSTDLIGKHRLRYLENSMSSAEAEKKALAHLCHTLLNTSEFLYVP